MNEFCDEITKAAHLLLDRISHLLQDEPQFVQINQIMSFTCFMTLGIESASLKKYALNCRGLNNNSIFYTTSVATRIEIEILFGAKDSRLEKDFEKAFEMWNHLMIPAI